MTADTAEESEIQTKVHSVSLIAWSFRVRVRIKKLNSTQQLKRILKSVKLQILLNTENIQPFARYRLAFCQKQVLKS